MASGCWQPCAGCGFPSSRGNCARMPRGRGPAAQRRSLHGRQVQPIRGGCKRDTGQGRHLAQQARHTAACQRPSSPAHRGCPRRLPALCDRLRPVPAAWVNRPCGHPPARGGRVPTAPQAPQQPGTFPVDVPYALQGSVPGQASARRQHAAPEPAGEATALVQSLVRPLQAGRQQDGAVARALHPLATPPANALLRRLRPGHPCRWPPVPPRYRSSRSPRFPRSAADCGA